MNIPTKKLANGFELPVYGLGLWQMGGRLEKDTTNDRQEIDAIRAALDMGVTHIDTAESYGDGHAEELLARAKEGYDRSKLIIATKVSAPNQSYDGVIEAFEKSLQRIETDYIDLYMVHRFPAPGIEIRDTVRALDSLIDSGAVKHIGVCNMTPARFDYIQSLTKNKLVCNQVHYNLQYREIENEGVLRHAQQNDIFLNAWRPLQKGVLDSPDILIQVAKKYGKSAYQIAINWLISQQNVITLAKTSNVDHLRENLGALDFTLDAEDIEHLRAEFPDQKNRSDAVPLNYEADIAP